MSQNRLVDTDLSPWTRSIRTCIRLRSGKPCLLKRHFRGCLRQVIGYLDLLASGDPERFVWCSWTDIVQHARKWRKGESTFKKSMVFRCLKEARALGIIAAASRIRNGCMRTGFVVKNHNVLARKPEGGHTCVLVLEVGTQSESRVEWELPQSGIQAQVNGPESGMVPAREWKDEWNENDARPSMNTSENDNDNKFHSEALQPLSLSASSKEPRKDNPVEPEKDYNAKSTSVEMHKSTIFSLLSDHDELLRYGNTDSHDSRSTALTIGQRFSFAHLRPGEICEQISLGEFDPSYLKQYSSAKLLAECCQHAMDELSDEPFCGSQSAARIMGRAMELLRSTHGLDAPRGWVPIIRRLRNTKPSMERRLPEEIPGSVFPDTYQPSAWNTIQRPLAEEVLTHPFSCLRGCFSEQVCEAMGHEPALEGLLIETARKVGVPGSYETCLEYMNLVIAKMAKQDVPVPDELKAICKDLRQRLADMKAASRKRTSKSVVPYGRP